MTNTSNRPIYYSQIRVDPTNDRKLIQGGASAQMSFDGGKTWNPLQGTGHGDYHAIWINPKDPRNVVVGHDGGLDVSYDGGFTWDYHNDMALGQFYQVSADMRRPYWVCGGLQDNQAWCGPSAVRAQFGAVNTDWFTIAGGDGFYTRQDPSDWTIAYGEAQNASMSRYDLRNGTQQSITPRLTSAPNSGGAGGGRGGGRAGNILNQPADVDPLRFYWNAPFELSPHDPATVYIAGQYFFKSTNRGDTWTMNPKDLTRNADRFGMPIMGVAGNAPMASKHDGYGENSVITQVRESPAVAGVIWIGTDDGNLQVSQDGGTTFTNVVANVPGIANLPSVGLPGAVQVSRIEPSHFAAGTAYVAFDNHRNDDWKPYLFKTTDFGKTWTNVTGDLPMKGNINALREDLANPNLLFVGTEFNLFVTLDGGTSWKKFSTGLPTVRVDDLLIHPRDRDLIVATHGRSLWIADDITPLEQLGGNTQPASAQGASVKLFDPRPAVQWKNDLTQTRRVTGRNFRGENPQGGTAFSFWAASDMGDATIDVLDAQGQVVSTVRLPAKAGMNRAQWDMRRNPAGNAGQGGRGGRGGGRGGAPSNLTPEEIAAGQAAYDKAAASAAMVGGAGGQTAAARGRGNAGGGVPFVAGGGRGGFGRGGGGLLDPGTYKVRLTVGGQTLETAVEILEDIWMR